MSTQRRLTMLYHELLVNKGLRTEVSHLKIIY